MEGNQQNKLGSRRSKKRWDECGYWHMKPFPCLLFRSQLLSRDDYTHLHFLVSHPFLVFTSLASPPHFRDDESISHQGHEDLQVAKSNDHYSKLYCPL